jgi:hypothetical protein
VNLHRDSENLGDQAGKPRAKHFIAHRGGLQDEFAIALFGPAITQTPSKCEEKKEQRH